MAAESKHKPANSTVWVRSGPKPVDPVSSVSTKTVSAKQCHLDQVSLSLPNTDESSDGLGQPKVGPASRVKPSISEADLEDFSSDDFKDGSDNDVRPSKKAKTARDAPTKTEVSAPSTSYGPRTKSVSKGKSKAVESNTIISVLSSF
ncbi:hypothetical protein VNI00_000082 [Paramarasmius palmivorus]|uniref:Uncharacterized protein n=1 Tax=Paramarasmius palmivorus TaxID=297713 RepID=A0AAW0EFF9_9AGAR